jgi:predicted small lipoprotein YifL
MKKVILILVSFLMIISLCGCGKEEPKQIEENNTGVFDLTEEEKEMYSFLTDNILTTLKSAENRFFVFTKDGKFLTYYGSEILFKSGNIYFTSGTYDYKDKVLTLHFKRYLGFEPDENGGYILKEKENIRDEKHEDFYLIKRQSYEGEKVYAGVTTFRLEPVGDNVPVELYNYMKQCLNNDFKDFDLEKAKSLEVPFD